MMVELDASVLWEVVFWMKMAKMPEKADRPWLKLPVSMYPV